MRLPPPQGSLHTNKKLWRDQISPNTFGMAAGPTTVTHLSWLTAPSLADCSLCGHTCATSAAAASTHAHTNGLSRGKHCSELPRRFKRARTHTHSTHSRAKLKPWASTLPTETASLQWLPACNSEPTLGVKRCNESLKGCHSACTDNWRRTVA